MYRWFLSHWSDTGKCSGQFDGDDDGTIQWTASTIARHSQLTEREHSSNILSNTIDEPDAEQSRQLDDEKQLSEYRQKVRQ